jgi:hypothetical protein
MKDDRHYVDMGNTRYSCEKNDMARTRPRMMRRWVGDGSLAPNWPWLPDELDLWVAEAE